MKSLKIADYHIGVVCALPKEMTAVRAVLDEEHAPVNNQDPQDENNYVLGEVHEHNVVIACLPAGVYGTTSAATVGKDMFRTFENVRIGLMVGIGGGIPQEGFDIRLGDVVVSQPDRTHGGVVQYDLGKHLEDGRFRRKGVLGKPPKALLTALSRLQSEIHFHPDIISKNLADINAKYPILSDLYRYPGVNQDQLHCSHSDPTSQFEVPDIFLACVDGKISRRDRCNNDPVIHCGTIASGNQLLKNARFRDQLAQEEGAICVEMEAAGLMDAYPCIVIRGICDYADCHKNDVWQDYAAATAAACAKEILRYVVKQQVNSEIPVTIDTMAKQQELQESHRREIRYQEEEKHRKCHEILKTSDYEGFKNLNPDAAPGTCRWVLNNQMYQDWCKSSQKDLIWISADPGCGKSVLVKSLVDSHLSLVSNGTTGDELKPSICYFFFKDNEQQSTLSVALCAILHQLFEQQPKLIRHALNAYDKCGSKLAHDTHALWRVLLSAVSDLESTPVFCVLDALDECRDGDQTLLLDFLHHFIRGMDKNISTRFKWLITSRPYVEIEDIFEKIALQNRLIRLRGEYETDQIREEINTVIEQRMDVLARDLKLSSIKKDEIKQQLVKMNNRTYLWLYLAIDEIKSTFRNSLRPAQETIVLLPDTVEAAYGRILARVTREDQRSIARKVLTIIVGARRALTTSEMAYALDIATLDPPPAALSDLTIAAQYVKNNISQWCGLFVFVDRDRLYLLHQTARDFLLADANNDVERQAGWKHCLRHDEVEMELTRICVLFLCLSNFNTYTNRDASHPNVGSFYTYAAKYWLHHAGYCENIVDNVTVRGMQMLYDTSATRFDEWTRVIWGNASRYGQEFSMNGGLQFASGKGHHVITEKLLHALLMSRHTPLDWATYIGNLEVVRMLLKYGTDTSSSEEDDDDEESTAPCRTSIKFDTKMRSKMLRQGADVNLRDTAGETALHRAAAGAYMLVIDLLLIRHGADVDVQDFFGQTALHKALIAGHIEVAKLLIDNFGANVNLQDNNGRTALHYASYCSYTQLIEILLKRGVNANLRGKHGETALHVASFEGHTQVIELLIPNSSASIDRQDYSGWTALHYASYYSRKQVTEVLLKKGAGVNIQNNDGRTPLHLAAVDGHPEIITLLLKHSARVNIHDHDGQGPLQCASIRGHVQAVTVLLAHGVNIDFQDDSGWTALHVAAAYGHTQVVELLLKHNANVHLQDHTGKTALGWASASGFPQVVELLSRTVAKSNE